MPLTGVHLENVALSLFDLQIGFDCFTGTGRQIAAILLPKEFNKRQNYFWRNFNRSLAIS